jgi:AcrR family transcriptional regulator
MPGIRERKKQETRKAIMDAAMRLFSQRGFERTSIEQLASAAGIGKGTIYSYFKTKSEIFHAFCEDELDCIHHEFLTTADLDAPLIDLLMVLYMGEFNFISRNKEFGRLLMQHMVFPMEKERGKTREMDDQWLELVFTLYRRAQQRQELRKDIDLLYISGHFYGLYIMAISSWYSGRIRTEEFESELRRLFQQAIEGLASPDKKESKVH